MKQLKFFIIAGIAVVLLFMVNAISSSSATLVHPGIQGWTLDSWDTGPPPAASNLLLEGGDIILLESGDKILLE